MDSIRSGRKRIISILLTIGLFILSTCSEQDAAPPLLPAVTETVPLPPPTAVTPTAPPTTTAAPPLLTTLQNMNVRSGPGVRYEVVGLLPAGQTAELSGRTENGDWWQIVCPEDIPTDLCWLSGDPAFTAVENETAVPLVSLPPTPQPTPISQTPLVAYATGGEIWLLPLALEGAVYNRAAEPQRLVTSATHFMQFSPDGRYILFGDRILGQSYLGIAPVDGSEAQILLDAAALPLPTTPNNEPGAWINAATWAPDSQHIFFNTGQFARQGPSLDLWRLSLSGEVAQLLGTEEGGGRFAVSPNGATILLTSATEVIQLNGDGSGREVLLQYEQVITYSDDVYFPRIHWTADGQTAHLAIPSPDPFLDEAHAQIWAINKGVTEPQEQLGGNILFGEPFWTADGTQLMYVQEVVTGETVSRYLILAEGDGRNPQPYAVAGRTLSRFGWNPAGTHFIFSTQTNHYLGMVGADPRQFLATTPEAARIGRVQWLSDQQFLLTAVSEGITTLYSGHIDGSLIALLTVPEGDVVFDLWRP